MQEYAVTIAGQKYNLSRPFFVLATQNPIEQEGTYPLPEAQLDRFMFNIYLDYPSYASELDIVKSTTSDLRLRSTTRYYGRRNPGVSAPGTPGTGGR